MQQHPEILGWGADAALENRPGVPEELDPPRPMGNMSLGVPAQQTIGTPTAKSATRPLTPVYSTSVPMRGVSGVVRRLAYRIPDYKARRWMLLMLADRIDVIEHSLAPKAMVVGMIAFGALGIRALVRR